MLKEKIKALAQEYAGECIAIRHHLHAHPELSYQEHQTSAFVQERLQSWGIPFTQMAQTGIVATIHGNEPESRIIALRADMDALPIQEQNEVPYKSVHAGIMHACGHDVHTTCLLGAARILKTIRQELRVPSNLFFSRAKSATRAVPAL